MVFVQLILGDQNRVLPELLFGITLIVDMKIFHRKPCNIDLIH